MNKNNNRTSSTTKRLQRLQKHRAKTVQFFTGLIALLLVTVGFCYVQESSFTGILNPIVLCTEVNRSVFFVMPDTGIFPDVFYRIEQMAGISKVIEITPAFYTTAVLFLVGILLNSIVLQMSALNSRHQIQKQLEPLYSLANTALRLSDEGRVIKETPPQSNVSRNGEYDNRIHSLENAIDSLEPELPNAQLHTQDADLKGLEDAINSLLKRARESSNQQIRFVSDASHELRTPIAVIKGYTDMLDRWGKDDEKILDESITAIKTETEHMNRLVEQLLFLARGDSGRTPLKLEHFSLSDMVREVCDESMMIDGEHKWNISAEKEIPAYGDIALIKQAVRILVDNARKYTPNGEAIILRAKLDENGSPTIVVQDMGIGISADDMSRVFDRFYRSDPARVREKGGTGLGLSIAKWIVDRHEGYFEVLSREDFGTRITIHLPKPPAIV